ncbi:MAG: DUF559 domain-containing protein [Pseudomonadota bacterium]
MPNWKPRDTKRAKTLRNSATPAERHLWKYLGRSQLGAKFSRQMPVGPFFVDFLCRSHKLAIEIDGFSHDVQPERDVLRDQHLRDAGFRILHFSNEDVMTNTDGVVEAIARVLAEKPTPGPSREREGRA